MRGTAMISALSQYMPVYFKRKKEMAATYEQIRLISENIASQTGGKYVNLPFGDIENPKPEDKRTGDEIVADVVAKLGLEVTE